MNTKFFCEFLTVSCGMCGKHTPDGSGICRKHFGKTSKKKIKADRFRGKSSFAKSNGMFESAQEN